VNRHEDAAVRLPFARDAAPELISTTLVVLVLWFAWFRSNVALLLLLAVLATIVWLGLLFFMRDPRRAPPVELGVFLAPADGRVMAIDQVQEANFVGGPALRIAIFLSLFDVHVNRSPMAGTVRWVHHVPGRFLQAFREEASRVNESNEVGLEDGATRILVKQIAGILARRIVCTVGVDDPVRAGQRLGMIKFGSRVELFLPPECEARVTPGEQVWGGLSIVASRRS